MSSNERTLNLPHYPMQHSTLALSKINLNAAHKSYRRQTQQPILDAIHKAPIPATAFLYLISVVLKHYQKSALER